MRPDAPPTLRERVSSRVTPFWLNPASIKGTVALVAGLFILAVPSASAVVVRLTLGIALVVTGGGAFWFAIRSRGARGLRSTIEAGVAVLAGVLLIVVPSQTIRGLALLGAGYLAVRGVSVLMGAFLWHRREGLARVDLVRGLLNVALAVVIVILPTAVIDGLRAGLATVAVIVGSIMLVFGVRHRSDDELVDIDAASMTEMVHSWLLERDIGTDRRGRIAEGLFFEEPDRVSKLTSWWIILLLSVAIATFGVIQDSTGVVIGAMLIAPLMTPILGLAAGIVNSWITRIAASASLVAAGAAAAIGLAAVVGQWVPIIVPLAENSQVTSRVTPNIIDMMIALAAGAAGAYANVDDRVSDSIAGVAIAVALVPPLAVVGLTLQAGMFDASLGALLLFLTNLVSIILAAAVVFFLTGFAPYRRLQEDRSTIPSMLRTVVLAAIVIMIPLAITAQGILSRIAHLGIAREAVADWLESTSLRPIRVDVTGTRVEVFLTGPGEVPSLESLEATLTEGFGTPAAIVVEHAPTTVLTY